MSLSGKASPEFSFKGLKVVACVAQLFVVVGAHIGYVDIFQWCKVTKYFYSSTALKYTFEFFLLY